MYGMNENVERGRLSPQGRGLPLLNGKGTW